MTYKKGQAWNKAKTNKMLEFEKETGKNAIYNGKITGQFEYWLFHRKSKATISRKKVSRSLKENKIMEKELIIMALKQLDSAEKERRLNPAQKRRRKELKIKLREVNEKIEKLTPKSPEYLNKKDKRPLKEFHYLVLQALKNTPDITQRNIYIEDNLVKKFEKVYLTDLVAWGYASKSDKNRYSITKQGKWRLKELARVIAENKQKAKLKKYNEIIRKLAKAKKQLPILRKKMDEVKDKHIKLMDSISEEAKKEWEERRWDYKDTWKKLNKKTGEYEYFKWSNPKEAEIIISIKEQDGSRELEYRKHYSAWTDALNDIEWYEKEIKKFKGTFKEKKGFRTQIQIEMELSVILKDLKKHPNDKELKKLNKELRNELNEAIDRTVKMKRDRRWD